MSFENHIQEIVHTEIKDIITKQGYVLETEFCTMLCGKYGFSHHVVIGTLRRIYTEMSLIKRRISDDLKIFYDLDVKGHPIVYLSCSNY